jgi:voltage-gated potassium channel
VTDSSGPARDAAHERRRRFRKVLTTLLRALGSTVALVAIYYLLPLDNTSTGVVVGILAIGLLALVVLIIFQVRSIVKATYPALRAVGALATSVPLFLLLFAATYFVMGGISVRNFSEPLTRTDALYFTVTVFSTVGFGDITATTEGARALVTGQMVAGIVIVGIGARIIVDAIKHGREQ